MSRKIFHTLLAALGFSLALPSAVVAQSLIQPPVPFVQKLSPAEKLKALQETKKKYPNVKARTAHARQSSVFQQVFDGSRASLPPTPFSPAKSPALAGANTTIWANGLIGEEVNYWSFSPVSSLTFTALVDKAQTYYVGRSGVSYADGHIRGIYSSMEYLSWGWVPEYLCDLNLETGECTIESLDDWSLIALETAQAADGTVYGEFYTSDFSGVEFGVIDYNSRTRTTFGTSTHYYAAMGITKAGELYGIAADDANLYKIDTTSGAETLIGSTGLTLMDDEGYYYQTGEIDQKDDTFYFYSFDVNENAALYTVDLATASLTKISDTQAEVVGMIIPAPAAEDGAPAAVTDLKADFSTGTLTGTLSFTAPSTTFAGDALSGELTYTVTDDAGQTLATGTATVGAAITVDVTVQAGGAHKLNVATANAIGSSPKASITVWAGLDVPAAVTNLAFTIDDNALATITWNAPTEGLHGGNIGTVVYDVYRLSGADTTVVASDLAATTTTDQLDKESLANYKYLVYAKNSEHKSAGATSDGKIFGSAIQPDWKEDFLTASSLDLFTIIDANDDGMTWNFSEAGSVRSWYSSQNGNDDWLITPSIHLKSDRTYIFSFAMRNWLDSYRNTIEVKWGDAPTAEGMTKTLLEATEPSADGYTTYTYEVQPEAEGDYYIGFHDITPDPDKYFIALDFVSVEANACVTSPDSVANLKLTPADRGGLAATVSFDAPSKAIDGTSLSAIDSIVVSRDGKTIKTFVNPAPGASLSLEDAVAASATYEYAVTPYLDGEYGRTAKVSAYIGMDVPKSPTGISLLDNQTNIIASWEAFTTEGGNGGYVDPSQITVSLYELQKSWYGTSVGDLVATGGRGATSITLDVDPEVNPDGADYQKLLQYFAQSSNEVGTSYYVGTKSLVVGPTLTLPFKESMAEGAVDNGLIWLQDNATRSDAATWQLVTDAAEDGDGGSALWTPYIDYYNDAYTIESGEWASLNMPKVTLKGAANPQLFFSLYAKAREKAKVDVLVQFPSGNEEIVATFDLSKRAKTGWETKTVDLSAYASERYVIVKFRGVSQGDDTYIGIDNINIIDQKQHDLEVTSFSVPTKATAGATAKTVVGLRNLGAQSAKNFDVVLYAQDTPVDTVTVADELRPLAATSVTLDLPVKITASEVMTVRAEIVYDADLNVDNNVTETKKIDIVQPTALTVDDLKAESGDNVSLGWTEPEAVDGELVTETFEDYGNFVTEFGDWTTVDGTGGNINGGFIQGYQYNHQYEAFAYIIFNPSEYAEDFDVLNYYPGFSAYQGYKYAASPYKYSPYTYAFEDADCWLISPALSGNAQTISFYATNMATSDGVSVETFEVLASSTDTETGSFTKLGDTYKANGTTTNDQGANWEEYVAELPEGTKYFAIRQVTEADSTLLFGLDDISYERGAVKDSVVGYNIYRDGQLIATVDGQTTSYTDTEADSDGHTYNVTVIYEDANGNRYESAFSNSVTVATGIEAIERTLDATTYDVYTLDGKAVKLGAQSLSGLKKGIYIINDKKFILR